ncbi:DUF3997 domain-containing protein [Flavobacterium sp. N1994]|uniref:DUF3997 domain-containing protein n=1 Tax=Flavobacterium sp. N1994 TaxID=2986827 RepID=UPI002222CDA4|nr:DUF3997 domain-containing protein [Flavobacterium sp. N1994]
MRKLRLLLVIFILTFFVGCAWLDESEVKKIEGSYVTYWGDLESNRGICKGTIGGSIFEIIVDSYVYSVGHSDKFIFAKTHFGNNPDIHYYIIDTIKNVKSKKGVYGPLNKIQFDSLTKQLKIAKIKFDMNFNEHP